MQGCLAALFRVIVETIVVRIAQEIIRRLTGGTKLAFGWLFILLALLGIRVGQQIRR